MYSKGNDGHYCPICGQKVNSVSRYSQTTQFMAKTGGKFAGKQVGKYIGYAVGSVVGLGEVGGLIGGFTGSQIAGDAITNSFNNATPIYTCPCCNTSWDSIYKDEQILDAVLQNKSREEDVEFPSESIFYVLGAGGLTYLCWLYCHTHESSYYSHTVEGWLFDHDVYDTNWLWYFLGIAMFFLGILTLGCIANMFSKFGEYSKGREIANMSLEDYARSRAFSFIPDE